VNSHLTRIFVIGSMSGCSCQSSYESNLCSGCGSMPGPILYWRLCTALLCNTCFLHAARMPPSCRPSANMPADLNIMSPIDHSAVRTGLGHRRLYIPAGSVRLCSASTWSHRRAFLFPYHTADDGGDFLLDYSIQNVNYFATKN